MDKIQSLLTETVFEFENSKIVLRVMKYTVFIREKELEKFQIRWRCPTNPTFSLSRSSQEWSRVWERVKKMIKATNSPTFNTQTIKPKTI